MATLFIVVLIPGSLIANSKNRSDILTCRHNLQQLTAAWALYAEDFDGPLPGNSSSPVTGNWVNGILDLSTSSDNISATRVLSGTLGAYTRDARLYRCPSDPSVVRINSQLQPRIRSFSMNHAVGFNATGLMLPSPPYRVYRRFSEIASPAPSQLWVFTEEHPESINDGSFAFSMPSGASSTRWIDYPASWHNGSCALAFGDNHVEIRRWADPRTTPARLVFGSLSPGNVDVIWLSERTSSRQN